MLNWPVTGGVFTRVSMFTYAWGAADFSEADPANPNPPYRNSVGSFCGKFTRTGTDCYAYQDIVDPRSYRLSTGTFKLWALSRVASQIRIAISDGITTTYSSYHTGSFKWEELSVSHLVSNACVKLQAQIHNIGSNTPIYVQEASFTVPNRYNYGQLSCYEIIEQLVKSIGGTLTYESRSSKATSFYPCLDVKSGQTAASVLNMVLDLIPDKIKWYGNDAVMYYPQSTDSPIYYYRGPS